MAKNDQNAKKFKNLFFIPKKSQSLKKVHSVIMWRHGLGQKTASDCNLGLAKDPK